MIEQKTFHKNPCSFNHADVFLCIFFFKINNYSQYKYVLKTPKKYNCNTNKKNQLIWLSHKCRRSSSLEKIRKETNVSAKNHY